MLDSSFILRHSVTFFFFSFFLSVTSVLCDTLFVCLPLQGVDRHYVLLIYICKQKLNNLKHYIKSYCGWSSTSSTLAQVHRPVSSTTRRSRVVLETGRCTWVGVARGAPPLTLDQVHQGQVQVPRGEAEWYLHLDEVDLTEVARGAPPLTLDQVHQGQVQVPRGEAEWYLHLDEVDLIWSCTRGTECNFCAMLTRWEASTPRRSRGVLVLPPS